MDQQVEENEPHLGDNDNGFPVNDEERPPDDNLMDDESAEDNKGEPMYSQEEEDSSSDLEQENPNPPKMAPVGDISPHSGMLNRIGKGCST